LRAFVAVELPREVVDSLQSFQGELEACGADLKLVERENLHFTVKFLGEISEAQASEAGSRMRNVPLKSFEARLSGVGAFPDPGRPRVIWAGVPDSDRPPVESMAREVIRALDGIGEKDERPFQAHVTLARVRSPTNLRQLESILRNNSERPFGVTKFTELRLKSSRLTPSGPVYSDVTVVSLG
jgi:RNA 2',3'-cyclic 3'-phosphodiesterase